MPELARLSEVDLREIWAHEERDFSSWLAKKENLDLLSEELGIELELIRREAPVGAFEADILAEEIGSHRKVLIENQLSTTDHQHLGKLITYASGLDAAIIVWIVGQVREEHKRAIEWLNEHTDQEIGFFLVQMKVYQIGNSPYAPKFHIVVQPNDWAKTVKRSFGSTGSSQTKLLQYEYWASFNEYAQNKTGFRLKKPRAQNYYDLSFGYSNAHITLIINQTKKQFSVELYIPSNSKLYQCLHAKRNEIENALGQALDWHPLPGKKASRIKALMSGDLAKKEEWEKYHKWMLETAEKFKVVLGPEIQECLRADSSGATNATK